MLNSSAAAMMNMLRPSISLYGIRIGRLAYRKNNKMKIMAMSISRMVK